MLTIQTGNFMVYAILFAGNRTAYSDLCVRTAENEGSLFIAYDADKPVGFLCAEDLHRLRRISYVFTKPEFRRRGVMKALIQHAADTFPHATQVVMVEDTENAEIVFSTLRELGFEGFTDRVVYSCSGENLWNKWDSFMQRRVQRLVATLERQGYRAVSFADADENVLRQIYHSDESDYHNELNYKSFFDNAEKGLSMKDSTAVIRDGRLAAYTTVLRPERSSAVFSNISSAQSAIGSGVILMSLAASVNILRASGECNRVSYCIYVDNTKSNQFREKILNEVTTDAKKIMSYFYLKKVITEETPIL